MKRLLTVLALSAGPAVVSAQAPSVTVPVSGSGLRPAQAALTVGGLVLLSSLFDNGVHLESQEWRGGFSDGLSRVGYEFGNGRRMLPLLGAAWLAGAAFDNPRVKDLAGHALAGGIAAGLAATGLKFITGRERPNSGMDNDHFRMFRPGDSSFPSGHASIAFGMATALASEFDGKWDDVGLYGLASLTALSRINDNKHWLSDVVAGAAVGIVAGRWATRGHRRTRLTGVPGGLGVSLDF